MGMEQRQDSNQREYMRRQDGRMNNFYSYERMLQRQNEARRNMNNRQMNMNNQHRMFKREADSSFEYDVVAEHDNSQMSRNQQMMDVMIRPQQTYQMDNRMNNYMNQMDSRRNLMDSRMNQMDSRMHQMNSRRNQMDSHQMDQYNMNNQMTNQMTNQMHQGQRQFGDNAFGFNRASMQYQNRQLQQDQL